MDTGSSIQATKPDQPPKGGIDELANTLDNLDNQPLINVLQSYRYTGRPGYPVKAMWRAFLTKLLLKIRFNNHLLERLRGSRKLREVCGFGDNIPSESAFSRFTTRLANHTNLMEPYLIKVTNEIKGLVPAVKRRENRQDQPLPPLGATIAIDFTLFESYANPNRKPVSDPDAKWGIKHSSRSKNGKTEWGFGYKMHLVSDATHGVPLAFTITPANTNDSPQLRTVVNKTLNDYPWMEPRALLADRGYDSLTNHQFLFGLDIIPIIHIRKPVAADGYYENMYTASGKPTCMSQQEMDYVRTDQETGAHLFQCSPQGCPLKTQGTKAITHCAPKSGSGPRTTFGSSGHYPGSQKPGSASTASV